ncbi:MAG: ABC transporter ATP-binding protein [Propionibacteriaceae bacterium]|nr:ABC transporter ATP-binding protein [Propionibacteriaceae bacterium]
MTRLVVDNVSHTYDHNSTMCPALTEVSFEAHGGELVGIVGPSGCGKSTLLSIIGGIISPTSGCLLLDGKEIDQRDTQRTKLRNSVFGFVFQDFALIEQDSARTNVELPLRYNQVRIPGRIRRQRAVAALKTVDMDEYVLRPVRLLSGGQRQRVGLARALVNDPKIVLADEPTGALDTKNSDMVFSLLKSVATKGRLVIVVTHNFDLALACDRVIALRDGRIVAASDVLPRRMVETVQNGKYVQTGSNPDISK